MNAKKYYPLALILLGFLGLLAVIYFSFFYNFGPDNTDQNINNQPSSSTVEKKLVSKNDNKITPVITENVAETDLKNLASSFAERFGSYSSDSNYQNIRELMIFMNNDMQAWAEKFLDDALKAGSKNSAYYGITTKSLGSEIQSQADDNAEVLVKTHRQEESGATGAKKSFIQNILIKFVKDGGAWKVASADWAQ